jgi:hypothetical protein
MLFWEDTNFFHFLVDTRPAMCFYSNETKVEASMKQNGKHRIAIGFFKSLAAMYGKHTECARVLQITPRTYANWRLCGFKTEAQRDRALTMIGAALSKE